VDRNIAVALLYVVLNTLPVRKYLIPYTYILHTYYIRYAAGGTHVYVYNTTRVGIHIAWRAQEKGVAPLMELVRSFTSD